MSDKKIFGGFVKVSDKSGVNSCCEPGSSCCGPSAKPHGKTTRTLRVFDPPMCCSTGVCGPNVNPALVRFSADLNWLEEKGVAVERFNLAHSPRVFAEDKIVCSELAAKGDAALPMILVNGKVMASGVYPSRDELSGFVGLNSAVGNLFTPMVAELVAIGAAIACNCDSCLRYHVKTAKEIGVSSAEIKLAVEMATKVKEAPHNIILRLAERLTQSDRGEGEPSEDS